MRLTYQHLSIATFFQLQDLMVCISFYRYDFMGYFIAFDAKAIAFIYKSLTVYQAIQNIGQSLTVSLSL
ncbi:TPA: hypothetical protein TXU84_001891 [Streptococcus suis]|uniref:hypothetical protein n=1 Tax=Streptococcus suis TaxID=1307 RepID=UPI00287F5588|nr:hypothetical protein [Streptococcus suis]WNF78922.1 hypothetical protein RJW55_05400 [Streptococcus suis]HEL1784874.1 hypothetical protein [Streptococcus suis]HEL1788314.1 hypothetical protein [Streptococcus suis]HEL2013792.1 hypothetical protein [Streptococcus suis]